MRAGKRERGNAYLKLINKLKDPADSDDSRRSDAHSIIESNQNQIKQVLNTTYSLGLMLNFSKACLQNLFPWPQKTISQWGKTKTRQQLKQKNKNYQVNDSLFILHLPQNTAIKRHLPFDPSLNPSFSAGCKQIRRRSIHIGGISGTNNNIQCIIELQFFGDEMFTELRQAFAKSQSKVSSLRENQMKSSRKDFRYKLRNFFVEKSI